VAVSLGGSISDQPRTTRRHCVARTIYYFQDGEWLADARTTASAIGYIVAPAPPETQAVSMGLVELAQNGPPGANRQIYGWTATGPGNPLALFPLPPSIQLARAGMCGVRWTAGAAEFIARRHP
jgi:hypothetical protein